MTRVVAGERLIDDPAKEILRRQLWLVAEFCGVEILTYAILSNHFHILVRVPQKSSPSDTELLRRYRLLHPKPTKYQQARIEVIEAQLVTGGPEGQAWRRRQLALMGDVSNFMKLLKQRFAIWFNKAHRRYGTLFAERFKSVLVECSNNALRTMAFYIDLNPVRAGLVADPKDYRFCGYGEAIAGNATARAGLCQVHGGKWQQAHAAHRIGLFGTGSAPRLEGGTIAPAAFQKVLRAKGQLPMATVLRCRLRHFTDGAVLGSQAFVATQLAAYRRKHGQHARTAPRALPPLTDWSGLATLRSLRMNPFG
jgi:hypothetical protein